MKDLPKNEKNDDVGDRPAQQGPPENNVGDGPGSQGPPANHKKADVKSGAGEQGKGAQAKGKAGGKSGSKKS